MNSHTDCHSFPTHYRTRSWWVDFSFVFVLLIGAILFCAQYWYYAEYREIRSRVGAIPGVHIIRMGGLHDTEYEDIWAEISVAGKGMLELQALTVSSFDKGQGPRIVLRRIGPWIIDVEGEGFLGAWMQATGNPTKSKFTGGALELGSAGAFTSMFPCDLNTVQDVIGDYDEIVRVLTAWPNVPARKTLVASNGTVHRYGLIPITSPLAQPYLVHR